MCTIESLAKLLGSPKVRIVSSKGMRSTVPVAGCLIQKEFEGNMVEVLLANGYLASDCDEVRITITKSDSEDAGDAPDEKCITINNIDQRVIPYRGKDADLCLIDLSGLLKDTSSEAEVKKYRSILYDGEFEQCGDLEVNESLIMSLEQVFLSFPPFPLIFGYVNLKESNKNSFDWFEILSSFDFDVSERVHKYIDKVIDAVGKKKNNGNIDSILDRVVNLLDCISTKKKRFDSILESEYKLYCNNNKR